MQARHQVSFNAVALIKRFEGYRPAAARLPDGRWTIGYGHTRSARAGVRIDETDASALLLYDLGEVAVVLNETIFTPLTPNQFDALASFAMNIGVDEFRRSTVLARLNEGALLRAASAIEMWRKADFEGERIVVDALVRRRAAEKALFLTPTDGFVPTPTPVVRPLYDQTVDVAAPAGAVDLIAPLDGEAAMVRRAPAFISPVAEDLAATLTPAEPETAPSAEPVDAFLYVAASGFDPYPQPEPRPRPIVPPMPDLSSQARRMTQDEIAAARPRFQTAADAVEPARFGTVEPFGVARFDAEKAEREPAGYLPLAFMLLVGVVLLALATYWFVAAHPHTGGALTSVIGWALGLTGVGLLAGAIYLLLERVGDRDDER